jgi:ankyrin repeat protein
MIDLLLKAQKKIQGDDGIDDVDDRVEITALHRSAIASNDITAKPLLKRGADPRRKDKFGRTPLHYAASYAKDINIIDVLVNNKHVDVNALDYSGLRALSYAKCNQHGLTSDIVQRLNVPLHTAAVAARSRRPPELYHYLRTVSRSSINQ